MNGWAAANGIAPSEMKENPSSQAALPFSRSAGVNSRPRTAVASAIPSGGTMPEPMTAAMIWNWTAFSTPVAAAARPVVAKT